MVRMVKVFTMQFKGNPRELSIINGRYAEGDEVHVTFPRVNIGADVILKGLERLRESMQPGDKVTLHCRSGVTEKGELTICEVSLTRDFDTY
jgi:predicted SnoaL-like aldol condensation-catalyzing enzyme